MSFITPFTILVADDDAIMRTIVTKKIREWGFEVVTAKDGIEAWQILSDRTPPKIALLDWMMPGMDGVEICRKLKERHERNPQKSSFVYTILLTTKNREENIVEGLDSGAFDFQNKPPDNAELRSRIEAGLRFIRYEEILTEKNNQLKEYALDLARSNQEREMYYQAFQHSVHGVLITDPSGRIIHSNRALEKMFSSSSSAIENTDFVSLLDPGRDVYYDLGISGEHHDNVFAALREKITRGTLRSWEEEIPHVTKDSRLKRIHVYTNPIVSDLGDIIAYVTMPVDVTDIREEEFRVRVECYRAITELAETRDSETGFHLKRMTEYVSHIARKLGAPAKFVSDIELFAPLHDIGKVGIPDNILLAPRKLSVEEFEIIKTHTSLGHRILRDRPTLEMAADIACHHHERFDGFGYPAGLRGEDIPLSARIVAVADVYDALRSVRPYKDAWSHDDAVATIIQDSGAHFDPRIVSTFTEIEGIFNDIFENYKDMPRQVFM